MRQIKSLEELVNAANARKAVIAKTHGPIVKPKPAAFILGWSGRMIHYAIKAGLFIYERKK